MSTRVSAGGLWRVKAASSPPLWPVLAASLLVVGFGTLWLDTRFLPVDVPGEDGFQSQLLVVLAGFEQGEFLELVATNWLIFIHLIRAIAVAPFLAAEAVFGPAGQLALLMLVLAKLVTIPYRSSRSALVLLPLAMPLLLSGRSVLVSAGVAYIALYLLSDRGRPWMLWLGALWVNLSSASVLMALLLLVFAKPRNPRAERQPVQRGLVLASMVLSLAISASDKIGGFESGETGYEAQAFGADNLFLAFISRATLLISFSEGQLVRAVVYSALALILLFSLTIRLRRRHSKGLRRLLLCGLPGILLEGLGVVGLLFPLVWVFAGFDPARGSARAERRP